MISARYSWQERIRPGCEVRVALPPCMIHHAFFVGIIRLKPIDMSIVLRNVYRRGVEWLTYGVPLLVRVTMFQLSDFQSH